MVRRASRLRAVAEYDFWANGFEGGPLQISADGGRTTLALFEVSDGHPLIPQQNGVAFSVDADSSSRRALAALRSRQPAANPSCSPISSTSTCVGHSTSPTPGETSTSSTATTTTACEPDWSRPME